MSRIDLYTSIITCTDIYILLCHQKLLRDHVLQEKCVFAATNKQRLRLTTAIDFQLDANHSMQKKKRLDIGRLRRLAGGFGNFSVGGLAPPASALPDATQVF